jgi:nucleotide-binding universal stress UspA family protein
MKKILVPTDFSTCAENAVNFAVESAKIFPATITLLHAFELNGDVYTDYLGVNKEYNQSQLHEATDKLAQLKISIEKKDALSIENTVYTGSVKESILQTTSEKSIDLVVMGTAGANGLLQKLWGSTTSTVIGKSQVPVLAIPVNYQWKKPAKILLSTNHFETEPAILDAIFDLADSYNAQVQVVVFTNEAHDTALVFLEQDRKTPAYEQMLKEKYKDTMIGVDHLFGTDFELVLQNYINHNQVDMLAMIPYKRSFADKLFHPSITKRMSYHTKIPLLAVPAKQE